LILERFVVGRLQANCYVVGDEETREVLVVDPGDEAATLVREFEERGYRVVAVFVTHTHLDHSGAAAEVLEALPDARFYMHPVDYAGIAPQVASASTWYGHAVKLPRPPDGALAHGDVVQVGRHRFTALHTPGHTPGSTCLAGEGLVFTGDVLFQGSIGRFDFPGSDGRALIRGIRDHLLTLPPETRVLPGHGAETTVEVEAAQNPFLTRTKMALGFDPDEPPDPREGDSF